MADVAWQHCRWDERSHFVGQHLQSPSSDPCRKVDFHDEAHGIVAHFHQSRVPALLA